MTEEQQAPDRETAEPQPAAPDELAAAQAELAAMQDKYLRTQAELDNFRKRARKELEDEQRYRDLPLLRDLLPVMDNIQRAIAASENTSDAASLLQGFKIVADQLQTVFKQHHCLPITSQGESFDPHLHEAVSQMANPDLPPGTVMHEAQVGYKLHDRVVRPSQVVVTPFE